MLLISHPSSTKQEKVEQAGTRSKNKPLELGSCASIDLSISDFLISAYSKTEPRILHAFYGDFCCFGWTGLLSHSLSLVASSSYRVDNSIASNSKALIPSSWIKSEAWSVCTISKFCLNNSSIGRDFLGSNKSNFLALLLNKSRLTITK